MKSSPIHITKGVHEAQKTAFMQSFVLRTFINWLEVKTNSS